MDGAKAWRAPVVVVLVFLTWRASARADDDSSLRSCLKTCGEIGCVGSSCPLSCRYLNDTRTTDAILAKTESQPVYKRWREWICDNECHYHCILSKETEDAGFEQAAIGYRDSWCLARAMINQPNARDLYVQLAKSALTPNLDLDLMNVRNRASVTFSVLNLLGNLIGLLTFYKLVHYSLPARPVSHGPYYPFSGVWTIYGLVAILYWFAQCVIHSRTMFFDMHIDSSFEVLFVGYALIVAVLRVGDLRSEQARVVVFAPTLAFLYPHLMYVNYCHFDYGLNMKVCLLGGALQHLLWITWAVVIKHPARFQLFIITLLAPLSLILRMYDFSYVWEVLDPQSLWIASAVPSSFLLWSFARIDARYQTKLLLKKRDSQNMEDKVEPKKLR